MAFLNQCTFRELSLAIVESYGAIKCEKNPEIEEFFKGSFADNDAEMLSKSYCFTIEGEQRGMVCAFSLATSSLRLSGIPNPTRNKIKQGYSTPQTAHTVSCRADSPTCSKR